MIGYQAADTFLASTNEEERSRIYALAVAARSIERRHDRERANYIAHEISKLFGE